MGALAVGFLSGQTLPPLGITSIQNVTSNRQSTARLGRDGSVYLAGSFGPTPTKSYGDRSTNVYFVSRVDATGNVVFTTALGGVTLAGMHIDAMGNVFVSGAANMNGFYTTPGVYRTSAPQNAWQFVCKLSGTDGTAVYCTYLDFYGTGGDFDGIDSQGDFIAVAGQAQIGGNTPPPSPGSLDAGSGHIYVAKLNPSGSALIYTAALGGSGFDIPSFVAIDSAGSIYVAGFTTSPDFPTTPEAVVRAFTPSSTVGDISFVVKLSADGTSLMFSTLGIAGELPAQLAVDSAGEPQLAYSNTSTSQSGVRRYNADASAVLFDASSYLTSVNGPIWGNLVMGIDSAGNTTLLFPVTTIAAPLINPTGACQFPAGPPFGQNGFLIRLDPSGAIRQATYLPRNGDSAFLDIAANSGSITVASSNSAPSAGFQLLTLSPSPLIGLACVGNSATLLASPLAAGAIVSLFGQGIGPATPLVGVPAPQNPPSQPVTYRYPVTLGATSVTFDGIPAPLIYVSSGQINTVVPFAAKNTTHVCVTYSSNAPSCLDAPLSTAEPGIFTIPATPGNLAYAAAVNQDSTINSAANPAPRGSIVTIFATGLGPLSSTPVDGTLVGLPLLTQNLTVTISSAPAQPHGLGASTVPVWAGQAPDEIAGLSQINFVVPNLPASNLISIIENLPDGSLVNSPQAVIWVK